LRNLYLGYKIILSYTINLRAGYLSGCFIIPKQKGGGFSGSIAYQLLLCAFLDVLNCSVVRSLCYCLGKVDSWN